ncbi:MAG: thioredoxin domain-containing protein [Pseudomonadota bacterium]
MTNRLGTEASPYLQQHAANPVDWYPWGDEALAAARERDCPILLSVGYSACHWCHVMAHESFEDDGIAAVMNAGFVNVKVDREERPDLDKVYQVAHHVLTQQSGGWPLTMFLDPHTLIPFFGGTYFPKAPRGHLPGFAELLERVAGAYRDNRSELDKQGEKLKAVFAELTPEPGGAGTRDLEFLDSISEALIEQYDAQHGGFGDAPKFPMPATVRRLLEDWARWRDGADRVHAREALDAVMKTLTQMARGGIFDHLGGGFCRYSVDARWMIPHFEKMLYDNGQLLSLYADALAIGPDELYQEIVEHTARWLLEDMRSPEGAFYAALDADSEGGEGTYYLWRKDAVRKALSEDEYLVFETLYGLDKPANFEGRWHLYRTDAWRAVAERLSLTRDAADALLASARDKLRGLRAQRTPPARDSKVLTGWNALAIKGLAQVSAHCDAALGEPCLAAAQEAMDFVRTQLWDGSTLWATWQGKARHRGYLDDYAQTLDALLTLLQQRWRSADLAFAVTLADALLAQFYDQEAGGFFFTAHDAEALIYRPRPTMDDALPPGNAIAAQALLKLGHLLGEPRYLDAALATLHWARGAMEQYPAGHCTFGSALALASEEGTGLVQVLVTGPAADLGPWREALTTGYHPMRQVYLIPDDAADPLPSYLPRLKAADAGVQAYLCRGLACEAPVSEVAEMVKLLS